MLTLAGLLLVAGVALADDDGKCSQDSDCEIVSTESGKPAAQLKGPKPESHELLLTEEVEPVAEGFMPKCVKGKCAAEKTAAPAASPAPSAKK